MFRLYLKSVAVGIGATVLSGGLAAPIAKASPVSTASTSAVAAAKPSDVLLGFPSAARKVVRPGMQVQVVFPFINTANRSERIRFRVGVWCGYGTGKTWESGIRTMRVPPNKGQIPDTVPETAHVTTLTVPSKCVYDEYLFTDGWFYVRRVDRSARMDAYFRIGRPFTYTNIRHNLALRTGRSGDYSNYQAHHTMPRKFEARFAKADINIHDPHYLLWWCSKRGVKTNHQSQAWRYNKRWEDWFKRNPRANRQQILQARRVLSRGFTYACP